MLTIGPLPEGLVVECLSESAVVDAATEREIQAIWDREQASRMRPMVDSELFSLFSRDGERLRGRFVKYKWFVAQRKEPRLFDVLGVRPLAVSGLLVCPDGIVLGKRMQESTQDGGRWELVPSGGVDSSRLGADGTIDIIGKLHDELGEEIGCAASTISRSTPFAWIEDPLSHVIDLGIELTTGLRRSEIAEIHGRQGNEEYDEIVIIPSTTLRDFVAANAARMVEVSVALLRQRGLL